jgi:aldose 1-epimerase
VADNAEHAEKTGRTAGAAGAEDAAGVGREVRLTAGAAVLTLQPENGGRIGSLTLDGVELLRQGANFGCFPMVPWCGRTDHGRFRNGAVEHQLPIDADPHAIHGTGRHAAWIEARPPAADTDLDGKASETAAAAFWYDLAEPWPYAGRVTQVFELTPNEVRLTMSVETAGDSFPAQAGWHPWFRRDLGLGGAGAELSFTAAWQEERGADHLPTGNRIEPRPGPWDDCFGMPDGVDVSVVWPEQLRLRITSPAEWVVLYDEQPAAVCAEPQSGPPNGLNSLPRLVTPIDPLEITAVWSWERLANWSRA